MSAMPGSQIRCVQKPPAARASATQIWSQSNGAPLSTQLLCRELIQWVGTVMMRSTGATNATKLTASLWHYCQHLYLLALPVSLSFPLARLLIALGPGLFTFTLCCPPPRRQVGKTMQKQAELSDGLLKGLKSPYHWKVPLEGEASEAICLLNVYFLKQ